MAINLKKSEQELVNEVMGKISLEKDSKKLGGSVINLSKCIVDLSKEEDVDIGATKAQVVFVIDRSGSMSQRYRSGAVQKIIDKLVPLGLTFDDDGNIVCMQFDDDVHICKDITLKNYSNFVKEEMEGVRGGTLYSPVLNKIYDLYFSDEATKKKGLFSKMFGKKDRDVKTADVNECPVFVIFITDGECSAGDEGRTNGIIRELSYKNCFIQFIGSSDYSGETFSYLRELDDLDNRGCDNTGFTRFDNIANASDMEVYRAILGQYAKWLKLKNF